MSLLRFSFGLLLFSIRLVLVLAFAGAIALVVYTVFWLPDVRPLIEQNPETTAFIERTRSRIRKENLPLKVRQCWVPLDKISKDLIEAVLIAEDDRFYQHKGFDFTEIKTSMLKNIQAGKWVRGGSTISQQLAKNLYLSPDKTLKRKFDEMIITWKLENHLSKVRILELYMNVVDWGEGRFGAEAAAQFYFNKPASKVSPREAASLAARLPNPEVLSSRLGEERRRDREDLILARMLKRSPRHIPKESPISLTHQSQPPSQGPLLPQPATLLPGIKDHTTQLGTLFKDKVTHALSELERLGSLYVSPETPEESPRAIPESSDKPDRVVLAPSIGQIPTSGQRITASHSSGLTDPTREPSSPVAQQQPVSGQIDPAIPRPLPSPNAPSMTKEKDIPSQVSQPRSKRLRDSLFRLERALEK